MKIGIVFPQTEIGSDPALIRDFAQSVEGLGFTHLLAYDHVLGANPERPEGFSGGYTFRHPFHEIFILFGYLASVTTRLGLASGVLVLPQRQTALVAKQTATLDVLSGGRLRLGVGIGWNYVEYACLNEDFHNRGKRVDEQVEVLRHLWAEPLVTYQGRYHTIPDAGLNPLAVQQPIPIWFGGHSEPMLRRVARLGDGWMPLHPNAALAQPDLDRLKGFMEEAGRAYDSMGIEAHINHRQGGPKEWAELLRGWQAAGATHICFNVMGSGFSTPAQHLRAVQEFARVAADFGQRI